jgi:hypothetical protein
VATTTTVQSSTSPAKSGATVTLTATVTATSGTPIGTVAFKDGAGTIPCTGGSQTLSSGQAICDTSFPTTGLHSITAEYSGGAGFLASTSAVFNQRIVNAGVTGIGFTNVVAGTGAGTAIVLNSGNCTGLGTANVTCSITNDRNASLSADVQFVNSSNNLTAYSTSAVTGSNVIATKNTSTSGSLTFAPSGSGSPRLSGTKSGNDHVYFTVSYTDGVNTFTATLKMD